MNCAMAPDLGAILRAANELIDQPSPITSMRVQESPHCTTRGPAQRHRKRRNQSAAYHRRIQKKWTKRYGTKDVPSAYIIDTSLISLSGRGEKVLVIHPSLMSALRAGTLNLNERSQKS